MRRTVRPGCQLQYFEFRAVRPVFDGDIMHLCATEVVENVIELWCENHEGFVAMQAKATII